MKKNGKILYSFLFVLLGFVFYFNNFLKDNNTNNPIFSVNKEEKVLSLTFDINWAETEYLYNILDVLDKYNVKGTFFLMGRWINYSDENIEKLKEIKNRGHELGNHSYIHPMFTNISKERMISEIKKTEDVIMEHTGIKTNLFRCPSGDYNEEVIKTVNSIGYFPIQWDVDSLDWKQLGLDKEYNRVIKNVKPGSIVLFHNNSKFTPENLDKIISNLKEQNYSFLTVGEMIYKEDYIVDNNGIQHKNSLNN